MQRIFWALGLLLAGGLLYCGLMSAAAPVTAAPGPPKNPASGAVVNAVQDGFELGELNTTQFQVAVPTCEPGGCGWDTVTTDHHGGAYAVHAPDVDKTADQQLVLNNPVSIPASATSAGLSFWQKTQFEIYGAHYYDGGVIEISTNGGATWADGGSLVTSGGYNVTLEAATTNPLTGRPAWGGISSGWSQVQVDLLSYKGKNVLFRLRLGTDGDNFAGGPPGWWVDDVTLTFQAATPCSYAGWIQAAPYPTIMADVAAASQGNEIYTFGGLNQIINTAAYRYDPAGNSWTPIAPLPAARYNAAAASDGTYVYVVGGADASITPTNTVYRYNPTTDSYTTLAPMSASLFNVGVAVLNGKLYRVGGQTSAGLVNTAEAYSLTNHTWSAVAALPQSSSGAAVLAYGNYLYVAGGYTGPGGATAKTYRYDPATNTWNDGAIADLPLARTGMAAALYNGQWMLAGGVSNATGYLSSVLAWDPASNKWNSRTQLPRPQGSGPGASAYGHFYTIGGVDEGSYIRAGVRVYDEGACPTPTAGPSPTVCAINFSDVHSTDYFYTPVTYLACHGVISGYGDNTFRPFANTTRGQLAKIVVLGFALPVQTPAGGAYTFHDVPTNFPFFAFVETAAAHGVVSGYGCGGPNEPCDAQNRPYFRPYNNVTRGQLSKIVVGAAGWALQNPATGSFEDVAPGTAFYKYVETATCYGIVSGYGCGGAGEPCDPNQRPYFRSGNNATRGQISKIVYGAVQGPSPCAAPQP